MKQIPKPTGSISTQLPLGLSRNTYSRQEYCYMVRDNLIEIAYEHEVNKIICSFNVGYLFNGYIPMKGGVKVKFTKKYDNLIFIGDEIMEVIDERS